MKEIDHVVSYHNIVKMRQGKINLTPLCVLVIAAGRPPWAPLFYQLSVKLDFFFFFA